MHILSEYGINDNVILVLTQQNNTSNFNNVLWSTIIIVEYATVYTKSTQITYFDISKYFKI